ncbi:MAG TPA: hypothetical protein VMU77_07035 [Acidimicrobiales bacterium]|nr:hypothetical protein [Acidimicrobiales bacterium]
MTDIHEGALPSAPSGDSSAYSIDTSDIEGGTFGGGLPGSSQNRRKMSIIALAVLGALVLGFLVYHFALSGGSSNPTANSPNNAAGTSNTALSSNGSSSGSGQGSGAISGPPSATSSTTTSVVPFQVYTSRDPFVPVALPILTGSSSLFGSTLSVTTTTIPVILPPAVTTIPTPGGPSSGSTTTVAGQPAGPPPSQTHVFDLISVFTANGQPTANVTVDGQGYQVFDGEVFNGNFTVVTLDVSTNCGTFLYADYEFELCSGQQATV